MTVHTAAQTTALVESTLIRDLVEMHPEVMPILSEAGLDLCCGGGHTVPDAARLHGLDSDALVNQVAAAIDAARE